MAEKLTIPEPVLEALRARYVALKAYNDAIGGLADEELLRLDAASDVANEAWDEAFNSWLDGVEG